MGKTDYKTRLCGASFISWYRDHFPEAHDLGPLIVEFDDNARTR